MKTDYRAYPPRIAVGVEIGEQRGGDRPAFIVGSSSAGRYLLLRTAEYRAPQLLGEGLTSAAIRMEFRQRYGGALTLTTLTKFLARLDETGVLAGERGEGHYPLEQQLSAQFYTRFRLFNPAPLFTSIVGRLGWIWTTHFFVISLLLLLTTVIMALIGEAEVARYGSHILREHYVAVMVAGSVVGVTREFARCNDLTRPDSK